MNKIKKTYDKAVSFFIQLFKWSIPTIVCMLSAIALIKSYEIGYAIELRILCTLTCLCMPLLFSKWSHRINETEGKR